MKKPKLLLIGAGRFGKNHLRNLLLLEKQDLQNRFSLAGLELAKKFEKKSTIKNYAEKLRNLCDANIRMTY